MNNQEEGNLDSLIIQYLDGNLDASGLSKLNQELRSKPQARKRFIEIVDQSKILESIHANLSESLISTRSRDSVRTQVVRLLRRGWVWGSLVLALLAGLIIHRFSPIHSDSGDHAELEGFPMIGSMESVSGSFQLVAEDGSLHTIDSHKMPLVPGVYLSQSFDSYMRLKLNEGSKLEFMGNGAFGVFIRDQTERHVILYHGFLTADIVEGEASHSTSFHNCLFDAQTTHARFLMRTGNGNGLVKVEDGRVTLTKRSSEEVLHLYTSESAVVTPFENLTSCVTKEMARSMRFQLEFDWLASQVLKVERNPSGHPVIKGVAGKINWASRFKLELVNTVVIPIGYLSERSIVIDSESVIHLGGYGPKPPWVRIVLLCTNGQGQFSSIMRSSSTGQDMKVSSDGNPSWDLSLPIARFDGSIIRGSDGKRSQDIKELMCVIIYTDKQHEEFNISSLSLENPKER